MTEFNFISERSNIDELLGLDPLTGITTIDLFQDTIENPFGFRLNTATSQAEGEITADFLLNLNLGDVDLGELQLEYSVDVLLGIPDLVRAGDPFLIDIDNSPTQSNAFLVFDAALNTRGLGFEDLSLDLSVEVSDASITEANVFSEDLGQFIDLGNFQFDDVAADIRVIDLRDGLVELEPSEGFFAVVGQPDETPLRTAPTLPQTVAEFADFQQTRRDSLLQTEIDLSALLADEAFLERNPSLRDFEALTNTFMRDFVVENTGVDIDVSFDLFSAFIRAGFDVVQAIRFEPTEIQVEVTVEDQKQSTLITDDGFVESDLEFFAPEIDDLLIADGEVNGVISFDLQGELIVTIEIEPKGSIAIDALAGLAEIFVDGATSGDEVGIGPLATNFFLGDPDGFVIVDRVRTVLPDDFFAPEDFEFAIEIDPAVPGPIEVENLRQEIEFSAGRPTAIDLAGTSLSDPDTLTPIAITATASDGAIILNTFPPEGVTVEGLGTNQVTVIGVQAAVEQALASAILAFDPFGVLGGAAITLTGDDRDGFANTPLGQIVLIPEEGADPNVAQQSGGDGNDELDANDLDRDGQEDDNPGQTPVDFRGGPGDDTLNGSREDDVLAGEAGNDLLQGQDGQDILFGGADDDRLFAGFGDDDLFGGLGDDTLNGGKDDDELDGGAGENDLFGEDGNDTLRASGERDRLFGGDDNDRLEGGAFNDVLFAGLGNDISTGGGGDDDIITDVGDDTVFGGAGDDEIVTKAGSHILFGDAGDDEFELVSNADDRPEIFGGSGDDLFEGSAGADDASGGDDNDTLFGGGGSDTLRGEDGNDSLDGGRDDDSNQLFGGDGDDLLRGGDDSLDDTGGGDILDAGDGDDTIVIRDGSARDQIFAGDGNDRIFASTTTASIEAGDGDDTITVSEDPDPGVDPLLLAINGGAGNDSIDAFAVARLEISDQIGVVLNGGEGNDTLIGTPFADLFLDFRNDNVIRSLGAGEGDRVATGGGADDIALGGGDDEVNSGGGDDIISGGGGADEIDAGAGDDIIRIAHSATEPAQNGALVSAGEGNDTLFGPDLVRGDTLNGGAGEDDFRKVGFGLTIDGGGDVDQVLIGDALDGFTFSITLDLAAGFFFDNTDLLNQGEVTLVDSVEVVELTNRVVFQQDLAPLRGQSDDLDLAFTLWNEDENALPGPLDVVLGADTDEIIANAAGKALLEGGGGDDFLIVLLDNEGSQTGFGLGSFLDGGAGVDSLVGGAFDDTVIADPNDEQANGRGGIDEIVFDGLSNAGVLFVDLGDGVDQSAFLNGADINIANFENIIGRDGGDDDLFGGVGTQSIKGLGGDDVIGADDLTEGVFLDGGAGVDAFFATDDRATIVLLGLSEDPDNPGVLQSSGTAKLRDGDTDDLGVALFSIEEVFGGGGNDQFEAASGDIAFFGGDGEDVLTGGDGEDLLVGGAGDDQLSGGAGVDALEGGAGDDRMTGGAGVDRFTFQTDFGNDVITDFQFGVDVLEFAANAPEDIAFSQNADGVLVEVAPRGGTVLLLGASLVDTIDADLVLIPLLDGNAAPIAEDDAFTVTEDATLQGQLFDDNGAGEDSDPEVDAFTVTAVNGQAAGVGEATVLPSGAVVTILANGTFTYDPNSAFDALNAGQTAEDSFVYTIADPDGAADDAVVDLTVQGVGAPPDAAAPTDGDDNLAFGVGDDRVEGGAGDDTLNGGAGGDTLLGEGGDDNLIGGGGADELIGGRGRDSLTGNGGRDTLSGNDGRDTLEAGGGRDQLQGGGGRDELNGGGGRDELSGNGGRDLLVGAGGSDQLEGGGGRDTLDGAGGRDFLQGGRGGDVLTGGRGADRFIFNTGDGNDRITDFEQGRDRIVIESGADGFSDLAISQAGANVRIAFANVSILIEQDDADAFAAGDFIF